MFTENLLRWNDPITGKRNRSRRGFGLPPPAKFRSGLLPASAIPGFRTVDSDSEEEVYGGRYSLDSSPQDHRISNGRGCGNLPPRRPRYGSDYTFSDVSSSRETMVGRASIARDPSMNNVRQSGFTEGDASDSATSSEFAKWYASQKSKFIPSAPPFCGPTQDDDDIPSAPSFSGSNQEMKQPNEEIPTFGAHTTSKKAETSNLNLKSVSRDKIENSGNESSDQFVRIATGSETAASSSAQPPRLPKFHASALGQRHAVFSYEACCRLCLHAWKGTQCMEAAMFLDNEYSLLRDAFGLREKLLQPEEDLMVKCNSEVSSEGVAEKPKKHKMKVQVRKVKMGINTPTGCSMPPVMTNKIKIESVRHHFSRFHSKLSSGWHALRKIRFVPHLPANGSLKEQSLAYVHASTRYLQQVSRLLKVGVTTLRSSSSSYEVVQETYCCILRLKSSLEKDAIKLRLGSRQVQMFFPDSLGDDLLIEVQDSKGNHFGHVIVQVAAIADNLVGKVRWWPIYREPDHELVGKIQLNITYSTTAADDNSHLKCGTVVAKTVAYDLVLEVAMKVQGFQQRKLLLHGPWIWLLSEFASYYGVSEIYTKLRYLSYVMDVATPTVDCLNLVYDLLAPVIRRGNSKISLSHQENQILGETKVEIERILTLVFENYKSLDESSFSGITEIFEPAPGHAAPVLEPAVKLYMLLHDISSPEAQISICHHLQVAAKKRARRHLSDTNQYIAQNNEGSLMDHLTMSTAYHKMKTLCINFRDEIYTDIQIQNQDIVPSFVDLPNLSASIYSTELYNRLQAFLVSCPPAGPSSPVVELVIATADFQRKLSDWKINPIKDGVDVKELFHLYILVWIEDKRLSLLESCKLNKVQWSGVRTQHSTTPFVDDMYERLKETLTDYEVIICRWPEYTIVLENAIVDIEKAVLEALDKQYTDVLAPFKESLSLERFGLKYFQKLIKRSTCAYVVPDELGILLNSLKRMLDMLHPEVESHFKSWGSRLPHAGNTAPGEQLSKVTAMLRASLKNYCQAVVEKLVGNTKLQNRTKLKKVLQDSKDIVVESDLRSRLQPLKDQLANTISHIHSVFETHVFISICRGYWDQMGHEILSFLENRKENISWYKGSRVAVSILDDTFASQMQQLIGNAIKEKVLDPPRYVMEVRSILCNNAPIHKHSNFYYQGKYT